MSGYNSYRARPPYRVEYEDEYTDSYSEGDYHDAVDHISHHPSRAHAPDAASDRGSYITQTGRTGNSRRIRSRSRGGAYRRPAESDSGSEADYPGPSSPRARAGYGGRRSFSDYGRHAPPGTRGSDAARSAAPRGAAPGTYSRPQVPGYRPGGSRGGRQPAGRSYGVRYEIDADELADSGDEVGGYDVGPRRVRGGYPERRRRESETWARGGHPRDGRDYPERWESERVREGQAEAGYFQRRRESIASAHSERPGTRRIHPAEREARREAAPVEAGYARYGGEPSSRAEQPGNSRHHPSVRVPPGVRAAQVETGYAQHSDDSDESSASSTCSERPQNSREYPDRRDTRRVRIAQIEAGYPRRSGESSASSSSVPFEHRGTNRHQPIRREPSQERVSHPRYLERSNRSSTASTHSEHHRSRNDDRLHRREPSRVRVALPEARYSEPSGSSSTASTPSEHRTSRGGGPPSRRSSRASTAEIATRYIRQSREPQAAPPRTEHTGNPRANQSSRREPPRERAPQPEARYSDTSGSSEASTPVESPGPSRNPPSRRGVPRGRGGRAAPTRAEHAANTRDHHPTHRSPPRARTAQDDSGSSEESGSSEVSTPAESPRDMRAQPNRGGSPRGRGTQPRGSRGGRISLRPAYAPNSRSSDGGSGTSYWEHGQGQNPRVHGGEQRSLPAPGYAGQGQGYGPGMPGPPGYFPEGPPMHGGYPVAGPGAAPMPGGYPEPGPGALAMYRPPAGYMAGYPGQPVSQPAGMYGGYGPYGGPVPGGGNMYPAPGPGYQPGPQYGGW